MAGRIVMFLNLNSEFLGYIHGMEKDDRKNYYDFRIRNISTDSLETTLTQLLDYYRFNIKRN
ncbi:MAG: hypothetical protein WCU80_05865, partial [Paludibacteraceae bacterium]